MFDAWCKGTVWLKFDWNFDKKLSHFVITHLRKAEMGPASSITDTDMDTDADKKQNGLWSNVFIM